jgi:hypothetical protein
MVARKVLLNGVSVNSGDFWNAWIAAGGNVDAYIKDALPTYGTVGALALTYQLSASLSPPPIADATVVAAFALLSHAASLLSLALIIIPMVLTTQYNCCIDVTTRRTFACQFGRLVPLLFALLIAMGGCTFTALLISAWAVYSRAVFWMLLCETLVVGAVLYAALPVWIQCWNANVNYGPALLRSLGESAREFSN